MTRTDKGIDWTKKDMFNGIGRPDLRPEGWADKDAECTMMPGCNCTHCNKYPYENPAWLEDK